MPVQSYREEVVPGKAMDPVNTMRTVFADAGYWIALLNPRDRLLLPHADSSCLKVNLRSRSTNDLDEQIAGHGNGRTVLHG